MKYLTRREFLSLSTATVAGLLTWVGPPLTISSTAAEPVAAARDNEELFKQIRDKAQATLLENKVPGMSVGIVHKDQLVFGEGFGIMREDIINDESAPVPMTPQSVQSMASVSKSFTGTAIMQLVEAGKVDINKPVVEYIPYFELADSRYPQITIRHLLGHTSGLPFARPEEEADFFAEFRNDYWYGDTAEGYVKSLTDIELLFDPGETFSYSDTGYDILADVIHKVSGELFEDYCKQHIFEPLGMKHSTFRLSEVDPNLLVAAYARDDDGQPIVSPVFPYSQRHAPSSCLHSSVEDMSRWIVAHLNHGKLGPNRILKTTSQKRLWVPLTQIDETSWYGWGWFLSKHEGHPDAAMFGAQPGVQTALPVLLPGRSLAVMALGNCLGSYDEPFYAIDFSFWALSLLLEGKCCHP